ncbi:MAG TPA: VWA domain-containing protein [Verrucomicrobia bacterium]|nr:VWA domain-containing protein [Verrucomicrobiota bacterium]
MNFMWPSAWFALWLAIPLILFYLIRSRLRTKAATTLLFWNQLSPKVHNSPLWRRLRKWLSLLLQILFLLLLILALSRPLPWWQSSEKQSLVLVLDPSPSMAAREGNTTRWENARKLVDRRITQMSFFDEAALILATDPPQVLSGLTSRKSLLRDALESAELTIADQDVRPALELASDLAGEEHPDQVVLFTDGVWDSKPDKTLLESIRIHQVGDAVGNTGITIFAIRRSLVSSGDYHLIAEVEHSGDRPVSGSLELFQDDRLIDAIPLGLKPGEVWKRQWEARSQQKSRFTVRLEGFETDDFLLDNQAEVEMNPLKTVRIDLVSEATGFLEAVLNSLNQVEWRRIDRTGISAESTNTNANAGLRIYYNSAPTDEYKDIPSLLIHPQTNGFWGVFQETIDKPIVSDWKREGDSMRFVDFSSIRLNKFSLYDPAPGNEVFVESFGRPIIFGRWDESRKWMVLPFDLTESDLVLRTAFPILIGNLVQSLRQGEEMMKADLPGKSESKLGSVLGTGIGQIDIGETGNTGPQGLGWWTVIPLWWWFLILGIVWILSEWFLFTRRITE